MKNVFLILVVLLVSKTSFAQYQSKGMDLTAFAEDTVLVPSPPSLTEGIALPKGKKASPKLRNMGIGLAALGVTFIVGGANMVKKADGQTSYSYTSSTNGGTQESGDIGGAFGAMGIIGGSLATIGGVVMTVVGQKKLSKAKKNITFDISPNAVYFAYRF